MEKELRFGHLFTDLDENVVHRDGGGGLADPSEGFGQEAVKAIEVIATVTEFVCDGGSALELRVDAAVPRGDGGVGAEPKGDELFRLAGGGLDVFCEGSRLTTVVDCVAGGFSAVPAGFVALVLFVGVEGEAKAPNAFRVESVDVYAGAEGGFERGVVGLPRNHTGVGAFEIHLEEDVVHVGDELAADVGHAEGCAFRFLLLVPLGDVLHVVAEAEGVFGGGKAEGFGAGEVDS